MNSVQISGEDVEGREGPFAQQMRDGGALEGLMVIYTSMQNHAKKKKSWALEFSYLHFQVTSMFSGTVLDHAN